MIEYHVAARDLVPGLDHDDELDVFDAILDLHQERAQEQKLAELRGGLQSRWA